MSSLEGLPAHLLLEVSHELKAPLASVKESIDLLLEEIPGPLTGRQARLLALNRRCVERLSTIVQKLLDYSQIDGGLVRYELGVHDFGELARIAVEELANLLLEKDLRVYLQAHTLPRELRCDGGRIIEVIQNLFSNAIRFSPKGSSILVAHRALSGPELQSVMGERRKIAVSEGILLEVYDRGPGVAEEDKERIFEPFVRVASNAPRGGGSGLGLAIARSIVEHHGGAIWARDRPGGGSVFSLFLPTDPDRWRR